MASPKPEATTPKPSLLNDTVQFVRKNAPATGMTLLAATGFFYADAAVPVMNFLNTWAEPLLSAPLNNLATQLGTVAAEGTLAVGALKSSVWGFGRIRKASELEKQNEQLREQLSQANSALTQDKSEKENALNRIEKALKKEATNLKRRGTALSNAREKLNGEIAQLNVEKSSLANGIEDLKKGQIEVRDLKRETTKKAHDVAKNQAAKQQELNIVEAKLLEREKAFAARELDLSKKTALLENSNSLPSVSVEISPPVTLPGVTMDSEIKVRKPLVNNFERLRAQEKSTIPGTPPAPEEVSASSENVRNRSSSPGIVH